MPIILPTATVQKLKDVQKGSLVSFYHVDQTLLGIRAERVQDHSPVLVAINRRDGMMSAQLLPRRHRQDDLAMANPDTFVLVHTRDWSLYAHPNHWNADFRSISFAAGYSGHLLIGEGKRGVAVTAEADCCYLDLNAWTINDPNADSYMSTRNWNIAIPSSGPDQPEWLFPV